MNDHVQDHSSEFATWEAGQKNRAQASRKTGQPSSVAAPQGDGIPVLEDVIRPGPTARASAAPQDAKAAAKQPVLATDPWPVSTLDDPTPARRASDRATGGAAFRARPPSPGPNPASERRRARSASAVNLDRLVEEAVQTALRAATPLIADIVTEQLRAQLAQQLEKGAGTGERKDPSST